MKRILFLPIRGLILLFVLSSLLTVAHADTFDYQNAVQAEGSLLNHWTFDGANDAARLLDSGPASDNLTPVGSTAYTTGFGGTSTASNLAVSDGYRAHGASFSESMTIEYLIKLGNKNSGGYVASALISSPSLERLYLGRQVSGELRLTLGELNNDRAIIPYNDYHNDEWYYVAAEVVEDTAAGTWVANAWFANMTAGDTKLSHSVVDFTTAIDPGSLPVIKPLGVGKFGASGSVDNSNYHGLIDEMALHNAALPEPSLVAHFDALRPAVPAGARTLLSDIATARVIPSGAPMPSDVVFSPRFGPNSTGAFDAAEAFHATRFDWVITTSPTFIAEASNRGYSYGGSISSTTADWITGNNPTTQRLLGRTTDHNDNLVGPPWLAVFNSNSGDINSPLFRTSVFNHLKQIIDAGGDRIQVDDPKFNVASIDWGGAYGPESMSGFHTYLETNTTAPERVSAGLPSDLTGFNYKTYVQGVGGPDNVDSGIRDHFTDFHKQSVVQFYADIRSQINAYAGRDIPFSINNFGGDWGTFLNDSIDYGMAELAAADANPRSIILSIREAESLGKAQVFTLPQVDVALNRKVIATTYAAGGHTIVPWDVYITTGSPRFFGDPADFADLYKLVRDNANLFDGYEDAAMIGPHIADSTSIADPVTVDGSDSSQIYALTRAVPDDEDAPIVVHLVDWDDTPELFTVQLLNEMFGFPVDEALHAMLLIPGEENQVLTGTLVGDRTEFAIPALAPWGMLAVMEEGDFNLDGTVNGADFLAWQRGFGSAFNAADLVDWENGFASSGSSSSSDSNTVPEPTSLSLVAILLLSLRYRRPAKRHLPVLVS